jgi:hypothetical protein
MIQVPWTGLFSAIATALGLYGLWWYQNLTPAERKEADGLLVDYAQQLYGKALDQLTSDQLTRVQDLVKSRMGK